MAILPYVMATLGVSWFDPSGADDNRDSGFGFAGATVWCGSGGECYTRVGGNTEPVQTDLSIGLSIVR